jgi:hypothetical protein
LGSFGYCGHGMVNGRTQGKHRQADPFINRVFVELVPCRGDNTTFFPAPVTLAWDCALARATAEGVTGHRNSRLLLLAMLCQQPRCLTRHRKFTSGTGQWH